MEFFQYLAPTKVIFGRGTETRTGALCKEAGATKVLIHYGGHSAKKNLRFASGGRHQLYRTGRRCAEPTPQQSL